MKTPVNKLLRATFTGALLLSITACNDKKIEENRIDTVKDSSQVQSDISKLKKDLTLTKQEQERLKTQLAFVQGKEAQLSLESNDLQVELEGKATKYLDLVRIKDRAAQIIATMNTLKSITDLSIMYVDNMRAYFEAAVDSEVANGPLTYQVVGLDLSAESQLKLSETARSIHKGYEVPRHATPVSDVQGRFTRIVLRAGAMDIVRLNEFANKNGLSLKIMPISNLKIKYGIRVSALDQQTYLDIAHFTKNSHDALSSDMPVANSYQEVAENFDFGRPQSYFGNRVVTSKCESLEIDLDCVTEILDFGKADDTNFDKWFIADFKAVMRKVKKKLEEISNKKFGNKGGWTDGVALKDIPAQIEIYYAISTIAPKLGNQVNFNAGVESSNFSTALSNPRVRANLRTNGSSVKGVVRNQGRDLSDNELYFHLPLSGLWGATPAMETTEFLDFLESATRE